MARKTPEELAQAHERRNYGTDNEYNDQQDNDDGYDAFDGEDQDDGDYDDDTSYDNSGDDRAAALERELAQLREQNAALQGRLTPSQQKYEQYRQMYEAEQSARSQIESKYSQEINELRKQLDSRNADFDLKEVLSEEDLEMFDEDTLEVYKRIAAEVAKRSMPDVESKLNEAFNRREMQSVNDYRNELIQDYRRPLSQLMTLRSNDKFNEWRAQPDNETFDPLVNSFLQATSKQEVDRLAKAVERQLAKFTSGPSKTASGSTDARTSLDRANQRRPKKMSERDLQDKIEEAKRLVRSKSKAQRMKAKAILDKLN